MTYTVQFMYAETVVQISPVESSIPTPSLIGCYRAARLTLLPVPGETRGASGRAENDAIEAAGSGYVAMAGYARTIWCRRWLWRGGGRPVRPGGGVTETRYQEKP
jgi:hypothetical protein